MSMIVDLTGKRGLIVGIANDHSIAAGCAAACRQAGAELAVTYLNERAEPYVRPIADSLGASIVVACDVPEPMQPRRVDTRSGDTYSARNISTSEAVCPAPDPMTELKAIALSCDEHRQVRVQTNDSPDFVRVNIRDRANAVCQPVSETFREAGEGRLHGAIASHTEQ